MKSGGEKQAQKALPQFWGLARGRRSSYEILSEQFYLGAQQSTAHPIYVNMSMFKTRFIRIIDLCYPTACGLLVQSLPGATHCDFVDVATLTSVPVSLLQSEMSVWLIPTTFSFSLIGGHMSSGFIHLCSLIASFFNKRQNAAFCPFHPVIWLPLGDNSRSAPPLHHGCLITPVISADPGS